MIIEDYIIILEYIGLYRVLAAFFSSRQGSLRQRTGGVSFFPKYFACQGLGLILRLGLRFWDYCCGWG